MQNLNDIFDQLKILYTCSTGKLNFTKRQSIQNKQLIQDIVNSQSIFRDKAELLWAMINETTVRPTCSVCGSDNVSLKNGIKDGFYKTCSLKCAANDPERNEKIKATELKRYGGPHTQNKEFKQMIKERYPIKPGSFGSIDHKKAIKEKYGVDNVFQSIEIKEKIKQTFQKRYGVDNPHQVKEIIDQIKATNLDRYGQCGWNPVQTKLTNLERYGVDNPSRSIEVREKIKATCLERYGVDNPLKSNKVRSKIKATCLERYGVEHPLQNSTIFDKCMRNQLKGRYKSKEMTLPSGKIIKYQGYENYVINYLLKNDITEDDLELERTNIPTISYFFEGKTRRYYPDIFIKSKKMLIEVKSTYTFNREVEKNIAKHLASKKSGFHHIIIIWDPINDCIFEVIDIN